MDAYERVLPDEVLIELVLRDNRWLLTRDRYLARRRVLRDRLTLLQSDQVGDQLRQLKVELHISLNLGAETPSRCADCNLVLESIPFEQATERVPSFVAGAHRKFVHWAGCKRVY